MSSEQWYRQQQTGAASAEAAEAAVTVTHHTPIGRNALRRSLFQRPYGIKWCCFVCCLPLYVHLDQAQAIVFLQSNNMLYVVIGLYFLSFVLRFVRRFS